MAHTTWPGAEILAGQRNTHIGLFLRTQQRDDNLWMLDLLDRASFFLDCFRQHLIDSASTVGAFACDLLILHQAALHRETLATLKHRESWQLRQRKRQVAQVVLSILKRNNCLDGRDVTDKDWTRLRYAFAKLSSIRYATESDTGRKNFEIA